MNKRIDDLFNSPVVGTAQNPTIIDAGDCRYLGEVLRLPKYQQEYKGILPSGVLDKSLADAGGSYVAMNCNENCIIVVPTRALRNSLVNDNNNQKESFDFVNRNSISELKEYLNKDGYKKIVCVYNSFPIVVEILKQHKLPLNKYKVVVDEYQVLLTASDYRQDAIDNLFESLKEFDYVTFLSATPIKEEFEMEELRNLPHYKVRWNRTIKVNLINREFESDRQQHNYICNTINDMLQGRLFEYSDRGLEEKVETIHVFCNSVKTISKICETLQLLPEQVRICRSNNFQGRTPDYISNWEIESPYGWVKKPVNFYTCCAYEGCNIFCNNGLVFVYSDGGRSYMQTDISTDLVQIAGRIRESKNSHNIFRSKIFHLYNKHYMIHTKEDLDLMVKKYDENTETILNIQKKCSGDEMAQFTRMRLDESFCQLNKKGDRIVRSDLKRNNMLYKNNLKFQYMKEGILQFNGEFDGVVKEECQHNVKLTKELYETNSFVMAVKQIYDMSENERYPYFCRYPELKDITLYLSKEEVHSLGYNRGSCINEVEIRKIMERIILTNLRSGTYTSKDLNNLFKKWNTDTELVHQIENYYKDSNKKCSKKLPSSKKWLNVINTHPSVITKCSSKKINNKYTRLYKILVNSFNPVDDITLSIGVKSGKYETKMITTNWGKIIKKEAQKKEDSYLISEGYSDSEIYSRNYSTQSKDSFRYVDCLILDIDDGLTIDEFQEQYKAYKYLLYTTWSHSKEHNKFRVILPMSERIEIYGRGNLYVKAKRRLFPAQDVDCSLCYFAPSLSSEIIINSGERYNSRIVYETMLRIEGEEMIKEQYEQQGKSNVKTSSTDDSKMRYWDKCVETINECPNGERNITIFKCVSQLKEKFNNDNRWIGYIRSQIMDEEKKKMFDGVTNK